MIGRRGFLQSIGAAVLGLSIALRGAQARDESYLPPVEDRETGMAIRFVRHWDAVGWTEIDRIDVVYGVGDPYRIGEHTGG